MYFPFMSKLIVSNKLGNNFLLLQVCATKNVHHMQSLVVISLSQTFG